MKLRFTPRAAQDLAAITDYIHERNPRIMGHLTYLTKMHVSVSPVFKSSERR
jgi:hypothetical protein